MALAALEAARVGGISVQFDHPVLGNAGGLMEAVDVLGDDAGTDSCVHQVGEGPMASIGRGRGEHGVRGDLPTPALAAHLLGGQEVAKVDGLHLVPDAPRATEVRDPRFGGNPGSSEGGHARAALDGLA